MRKISMLLFVGSILTFAACQSRPKTEEAVIDSTAASIDSANAAAADSATAAVDSAAASMSAVAPVSNQNK